ncbi:MAG: hypothetical protein PHG96_10520, partial [Kiritimatiellae bacterium]|nr:hypothetical protein [Kiritimatiellia bacterium]
GNITAIGSTANIVALGMLEKRAHAYIAFLEWLKIGAVIGLVTALIAWGMLSFMPVPHPLGIHDEPQRQTIEAPSQVATCCPQP